MGVRHPAAHGQRGAALLVTLIVMALMVLGVLSFTRSADTANLIAGNTAFKQAATQAAELGLLAAGNDIDSLANPDVDVAGRYFATQQFVAAEIPPPGFNWAAAPEQVVGGFSVRRIVERMCDTTPVTDPIAQCSGRTAPAQGSQKAGAPTLQGQPAIYYRATVRVTGPRNSESLIQAAFSR